MQVQLNQLHLHFLINKTLRIDFVKTLDNILIYAIITPNSPIHIS